MQVLSQQVEIFSDNSNNIFINTNRQANKLLHHAIFTLTEK